MGRYLIVCKAWCQLYVKRSIVSLNDVGSRICVCLLQENERERDGMVGGPAVSRMADQESIISDEEKTAFDWCKEGRKDRLSALVSQDNINDRDSQVSSLRMHVLHAIPTALCAQRVCIFCYLLQNYRFEFQRPFSYTHLY